MKVWQREEHLQRPRERNVLSAFKALLQEEPTIALEIRRGFPGGQRREDRRFREKEQDVGGEG